MTYSSTDEMERRKSFRIDMEKELVDIVWQDDTGNKHDKKIACIDFSRGGLKVECDVAISVATEVTVIFKAAHPNCQKLDGRVQRCVQQKSGWFEIALLLDIDTNQ